LNLYCTGVGQNTNNPMELQGSPTTYTWDTLYNSLGFRGAYNCTWTATGPGGTATAQDNWTVLPPDAPTASITAYYGPYDSSKVGTHNLTLAVNDPNTKVWSSTNGTSAYTTVVYNGSCQANSYGSNNTPFTWGAGNTLNGHSSSAGAIVGNAGCTTALTYNVTGSGGSAQDTVYITTVAPGAAIPDLKVSTDYVTNSDGPTETYANGPYTLSWGAVTYAASCTLDGSPVSVSGGSQAKTATLLTQTHTLTCLNSINQSASDQVTVTVPPAPLTFEKSCNAAGNQVTLTWTLQPGYTGGYVRDATEALPFYVNVDTGLTTTIPVTPGQTYYSVRLQTKNPSNGAWSGPALYLDNFSCAPGAISVNLSASPPGPLTAPGATTLTWTTTGNPDSCTASNFWSGAKTASGGSEPRSGIPASTQVFDITCSKAGTADATSRATVVVNPPAPTASLTVNGSHNVTLNVGDANTKTWSSTNGTAWSSTYSTTGSCPNAGNSGPWVNGNTANGSVNNNAIAGNAGCTTTITYTVTNSTTGLSASDTIYVIIASAPAPDLTAGSVSPASATRDMPTTFSATISNIGTGSTGASFNNFMQVATSPNGGGTITDIPAVSMPTLAANGTDTFSKSYTFTNNGSYSLRVCADKTDRNSTGVIN
ncbi:MAG: CARDB domain-containing protein, partial [Dehalococcoidales bacterium]|nr:CARDB domain-containing protein [Dehalococcoidales bacterium]